MALNRRRAAPRRAVITWVVWVAVGVVLVSAGWVLVRAMIARDELVGALPVAERVRVAVLAGDTGVIDDDIADLRARASTAAALTSDPIWRVAEIVPVLGPNLTAFRQSAELIDHVAADALPALGSLASTFTVDSFSPRGGAFDLAPFQDAAPLLATANEALGAAAAEAGRIDTASTVPQVGEAVDQVVDLVEETQSIVGSLDTAVRAFPEILGADGPRHYLLMSLNNAELRATGGIPGALAVVTADDGVLTLRETSSAAALGEFDEPILPLSEAERQLYDTKLGLFMLDVNFTPDFARTGQLAQAMWKARTGQTVDGVIAVDPVALSYLLEATGPVDAGSGITLTAGNAVAVLLSQVYAELHDPREQDAFFVGVTERIFATLTGGGFDKRALIAGLTRASDERRLHIWVADPEVQKLLSSSTLAGPLPTSTDSTSAFGVYFNDGTGAKMDYYLRAGVGIASGLCGPEAQPNFAVQVKLKSTAPADAATRLPEYVTGGGAFGVQAGNILTNVYVYAPGDARPYSVAVDGRKSGFSTAVHDGRAVVALRVELAPGQSVQLEVRFLGSAGDAAAVTLEHTPMASPVPTSLDTFLDCPVPPSGPATES